MGPARRGQTYEMQSQLQRPPREAPQKESLQPLSWSRRCLGDRAKKSPLESLLGPGGRGQSHSRVPAGPSAGPRRVETVTFSARGDEECRKTHKRAQKSLQRVKKESKRVPKESKRVPKESCQGPANTVDTETFIKKSKKESKRVPKESKRVPRGSKKGWGGRRPPHPFFDPRGTLFDSLGTLFDSFSDF